MTCIVGMEKEDGGVIIGGDALLSDRWQAANLKFPKVFKTGEFVYGFCGSLRAGQILQHVFTAPQLPEKGESDDEMEGYMAQWWVDVFKGELSNHDAVKVKHEVAATDGSWVMIGVRGRLYILQTDFSVYRSTRGFAAIGSGEEYALGAISALKKRGKLSEKRIIEIAIEAAAEHAPTVGGPITIVETG